MASRPKEVECVRFISLFCLEEEPPILMRAVDDDVKVAVGSVGVLLLLSLFLFVW